MQEDPQNEAFQLDSQYAQFMEDLNKAQKKDKIKKAKKKYIHSSFTAGSHIISSSVHILFRSTEGTLWRHMKQNTDNIDIEFAIHDAIDQTFKNIEEFECGVFTRKGAFVASHPQNERRQYGAKEEATLNTHSLIKFKKYDYLDQFTQDWEKFLPTNSFAVALAQTQQKLICACGDGKIFIFLYNGLLFSTFLHPKKIITVFAFESTLAIIHQDLSITTDAVLLLTLYDIATFPRKIKSSIEIPMGKRIQLEWAGFTKWGIVALQTSDGRVLMNLNDNWQLVCQIPSNHRVHCVDIDCVTSFSITEPRGIYKDNEIGNYLIIPGPKSITTINADIQRLKILLLIAVENHVRGQQGVYETAKEIKEMLELRKIQGFFIAVQKEEYGKALDFIELIKTSQGFEECMKLAVLQGVEMLVDIIQERARLKKMKTNFNMATYKAESGIRQRGTRGAKSYNSERVSVKARLN